MLLCFGRSRKPGRDSDVVCRSMQVIKQESEVYPSVSVGLAGCIRDRGFPSPRFACSTEGLAESVRTHVEQDLFQMQKQ